MAEYELQGLGGSGSGSGGFGSGYEIAQPDGPDTPFSVVPDQILPSGRKSRSSRDRNTSSRGGGQSIADKLTRRTGTTNDRTVRNRDRTERRTGRNITNRSDRTITDRMDPETRAAYEELLNKMRSGGTDAQREGMAELEALLERSIGAEEEYTPDEARRQSQKSTAKYARDLRENIMPTISGAQEGAGLSGDALSALLAQDQLTRVSEAASAAELDAIIAYGELSQEQQRITGGTAGAIADDPISRALQDLIDTGISAYEDTTVDSTIEEIIDETIRETDRETTDRTIRTDETETSREEINESDWEDLTDNEVENIDERTDYKSTGNKDGPYRGSRNFSGGGNEDEDLAKLLAALGPNQNLQDLGAGAGDGGATASRQGMEELIRKLGLQF